MINKETKVFRDYTIGDYIGPEAQNTFFKDFTILARLGSAHFLWEAVAAQQEGDVDLVQNRLLQTGIMYTISLATQNIANSLENRIIENQSFHHS